MNINNLNQKLSLKVIGILLLMVCTIFVSCGKDDEPTDKKENKEENVDNNDGTPDPDIDRSIYKATDLYGKWIRNSAEVDGATEGITFESDGKHGCEWILDRGTAKEYDFLWSFKNDVIHFIDLFNGVGWDSQIIQLTKKELTLYNITYEEVRTYERGGNSGKK